MTQSITISDQEIYIEAQYFVHKDYSITGKEMILDIMSMYYTGQLIRIKLFDGENIKFSGVYTLSVVPWPFFFLWMSLAICSASGVGFFCLVSMGRGL